MDDAIFDSWYSYNEAIYYFDKRTVEFTQDQLPRDYEDELEVADNHYIRFRYCHAMLDRHGTIDANELSALFYKDLFDQSPKFTPWEQEISVNFKANRFCELFRYMDSLIKDERNKNTNKFVIIVKFGMMSRNYGPRVADRVIDDEEVGFVPACKSSIDGLEKVSGLGECSICLDEEEGNKEAKRMPCGHEFHARCIRQWLEMSRLCPLCRYAMSIHECFISNKE